jgi:prepilin peptidase dependent protein B
MPLNASYARQRGFTLPEILLAMGIGSVVMLAAAGSYPAIYQQGQRLRQLFWLDHALHQAADTLGKDLRRAGFCAGEACGNRAVRLSVAGGEGAGGCVLLAYDLNRNGRWEPAGPEAETFGYRLVAGALETQRGVTHCGGTGWERLLDPAEVIITGFTLTDAHEAAGTVLQLTLSGQSRQGRVRRQITRLLTGANA